MGGDIWYGTSKKFEISESFAFMIESDGNTYCKCLANVVAFSVTLLA